MYKFNSFTHIDIVTVHLQNYVTASKTIKSTINRTFSIVVSAIMINCRYFFVLGKNRLDKKIDITDVNYFPFSRVKKFKKCAAKSF